MIAVVGRLIIMGALFIVALLLVLYRRIVKGKCRNNWQMKLDVVIQFIQMNREFVTDKADKVHRLRPINRLGFPLSKKVTKQNVEIKSNNNNHVISAEWIIPKEILYPEKVILYFHGGGFVFCSTKTHSDIMSKIAVSSKTRVLGFNYRLAPEFKYPSQLEDAMMVYEYLRSPQGGSIKPSDIIFVGDSAGGNLSLCTALHIRDMGSPLPKAFAFISPWLDLTHSSPSWVKNYHHDYLPSPQEMQCISRHYVPDHMLFTDSRVSPIFADLSGLPPMYIQVSNTEMVYDDAIRLESIAKEFNIQVSLDVFQSMPHVFQAFETPQTNEAFEKMGKFIMQQNERDANLSYSDKISLANVHHPNDL